MGVVSETKKTETETNWKCISLNSKEILLLSGVPGYKNTEVGIIPKDWSIKTLGEIGEALIGLTYKPTDVYSDGILVLRSSNVQEGTLRFNDNVFVKMEVPERIMVREGDILICVRNGSRELIGKCAQINASAKGMTFGAFMAVFRTPVYKFAYHQFKSEIIKKQIHEHLGATINQITNKSLNSFRIPLPPTKAEQEAISGALSDADALIEALEQLITKKRQIKQGTMQELLTGKRRLPGFKVKSGYKKTEIGLLPEDWDTPELGNILKSMQLGGNYKNGELETNWPLIKMGNLGRGSIKLDKLEYIDSSTPPASRDRLQSYDILFNTRNTLDLVGKVALWRDELPEAYFNSNIMRLGFDEAQVSSKRFMSYILNTSQSLKSLLGIAIGTTSVAAIYSRDLVKLRVPLPSKAEQKSIAAILFDMDTEITKLEDKLVKTRQLKQGMMQELLTGKIRLI